MTISTTLNASFGGRQALQILNDASTGALQSMTQHAGDDTTARYAFIALPGQIGRAVTAIMNILLDAQGNTRLAIIAKEGYASARTGAGNDIISMDVKSANGVASGRGNDSIAIRAYRDPNQEYFYGGWNIGAFEVYGGDGDDSILIKSYGKNGEATDGVPDRSAGDVAEIYGGSGNDKIDIEGHNVFNVYGDDGDDIMDVRGTVIANIDGGNGDDTIRITATTDGVVAGQVFAKGGDGNDTIDVTGDG